MKIHFHLEMRGIPHASSWLDISTHEQIRLTWMGNVHCGVRRREC